MISSLCWVPKGVSLETPIRFKLSDEEYARIQDKISKRVQSSREDLEEAQNDAHIQQDPAAPTSASTTATTTVTNIDETKPSSAVSDAEEEALIKEFRLDTYDNDEDEDDDRDADGNSEDAEMMDGISDDEVEKLARDAIEDAPLFGSVKGLTYHSSNSEDPYVTMDDQINDEEEMAEMMIGANDNLILAAKTEDDISHVEVYLYEGDEDNLFVHHDIMLPSFPLCLEWISFGAVGGEDITTSRAAGGSPERSSHVAVGTFDPEIEVWNLNVVDAMYPDAILGGEAMGPDGSAVASARRAKGTGKKKRKLREPCAEYHVDAVMCLAWNAAHPSLLASGSADTTVKLWDLSHPRAALRSFATHKAKVQAVAWNPAQATVLATGAYDKKACVFDTRAPTDVAAFKLSADVEAIKWDPFRPERLLVSTEDGLVRSYDARNPKVTHPIFTLHAHDSAVSALDVSTLARDLVVTGSTDKKVKIWSTSADNLRCLASRDLGLGKVYSCAFSPNDHVVSVAGARGVVAVWNLGGNQAVRAAIRQHGGEEAVKVLGDDAAAEKRKEVTVADIGDEEEDEGEFEMGGGDDEDEDEDDHDEDMS